MSDPNRDWLEEELANLRDMQTPPTLLPKVMERVRSRSRQHPRAGLFASRADLWRSFVVALSVCLLALLIVVNPSQYFSALPVASAVLRVIGVFVESAKMVLLQTKIYHLPLLVVLAPIVIFSYAFLVTTACVINRLLVLRK
jgi:hypothetical protein